MQHESSLRAITNRLNVTPVEHLPRISGFLATSLAQCPLERQFSDTKTNDSSVAAHRLKTRLSALLQGRAAAGRLTAAVLIKAVVDSGSPNVLAASEPWARGLVNCLNKPDSTELKRLYLVTVTRLFVLTQSHPSLLREITTPLLPTFITASLGLIKPVNVQASGTSTSVSSPLLDSVLQCWIQLLPQHATVFRPFLARIKLVCHSLLGDSDSSASTRDLVISLLSLLLASAPKNTLSQEWTQTVMSVISSAHLTADRLFRAIIEEYEPNDDALRKALGKQDFSQEPKVVSNDQTALGPWNGIHNGACSLSTLIRWLESLVSTATSQSVSVPMGTVLDLTSRVLAVAVPNNKSTTHAMRFNKEASKEEKDELWMNLPQLHMASLQLLHKICAIFGQSLFALYPTIVNQLLDVFEAMSWHGGIRRDVYNITSHLLRRTDLQSMAINRAAFSKLIENCCSDLKGIFSELSAPIRTNALKGSALGTNLSAWTGKNTPGQGVGEIVLSERQPETYQASKGLLHELQAHCPASLIPRSLRVEMDRLSVLLDDQDAMLASVMRPVDSDKGAATTASLLPFLARSSADSMVVEALLRPRMPITQTDGPPASNRHHPQTGINDREEEDSVHREGDILSQLENSVNDQENSLEREDEALNQSNALQLQDSAILQSISTKKRTLDDAGAVAAAEDGPPPEMIIARQPKMPRLEEDASTTPMLPVPEGTNGIDFAADDLVAKEMERMPSKAEYQSPPWQPPLLDTASTSLAAGSKGNGESDSSDFEIPAIDTGFDTDEEEEL